MKTECINQVAVNERQSTDERDLNPCQLHRLGAITVLEMISNHHEPVYVHLKSTGVCTVCIVTGRYAPLVAPLMPAQEQIGNQLPDARLCCRSSESQLPLASKISFLSDAFNRSSRGCPRKLAQRFLNISRFRAATDLLPAKRII